MHRDASSRELEEIREEMEALRRRAESEQRTRVELAMLYELVTRTGLAEVLPDVYEPALDAVCRALNVDRASILLYDDDGVMRFKAWRGLSDEYRRAVEGHSPWTRDTKDPCPLTVVDVVAAADLVAYGETFAAEKIRALAFIPLVHQHKLLGKFMVYAAEPREFAEDELRLAMIIATQVAGAVAKKRSDAEAQAAREAAEAASRMKDEFLAIVSHELRSPLSAIGGWVAILRAKKRPESELLTKGFDVIERNVRTQARIIDDILDVSRIIAGKLVIESAPVSMVSVVGDALESVRTSAVAKDITIDVAASDDAFLVVGDSDRLRQIVWNLLSNAIKFTPAHGRVDVVLRRELGSVVLEVSDTGQGIDPSFLPHVFERFRQADSSTTRGHGGLGLGLAIVRHLVELHGGHVRAASEGPGRGAKFVVGLPVHAVFQERGAAPPAKRSATGRLNGVRVLVVDDEDDAREMVRELLSSRGATVETAGSAGEALRALVPFRPDVLVSDIAMPESDGYALIRGIRSLPGPERALPAIALTAYARTEDAQRVLAAGFGRHVPKPADPQMLACAVEELLAKAAN